MKVIQWIPVFKVLKILTTKDHAAGATKRVAKC